MNTSSTIAAISIRETRIEFGATVTSAEYEGLAEVYESKALSALEEAFPEANVSLEIDHRISGFGPKVTVDFGTGADGEPLGSATLERQVTEQVEAILGAAWEATIQG